MHSHFGDLEVARDVGLVGSTGRLMLARPSRHADGALNPVMVEDGAPADDCFGVETWLKSYLSPLGRFSDISRCVTRETALGDDPTLIIQDDDRERLVRIARPADYPVDDPLLGVCRIQRSMRHKNRHRSTLLSPATADVKIAETVASS